MFPVATRPADRYSPLYFLASLGAGGLSVTFFMYHFFWVPHPGQPVPIFEDVARAFAAGGWATQAMIAIAYPGIAVMTCHNIRLLVWNLAQYRRLKATAAWNEVTSTNAETQLLPAFALSMVAVGFAAPAAMSTVPLTAGISLIGSTFFGVAAILYAVVAAITGFNSMLHYGTARESGPTLLVVIPIMTVLGIMFLRQEHGMAHTFGAEVAAVETLVFLSRLMAVQVVFLLLDLLVLNRQGYWRAFVFGEGDSVGAYALICPGVALSVMLHFWLNQGLVAAGLVAKFSVGDWAVAALSVAIQMLMVWFTFHLNRRHFGRPRGPEPVPAE